MVMCIYREHNDCLWISYGTCQMSMWCNVLAWNSHYLMLLPFLHRYCQNKINTNLSGLPKLCEFWAPLSCLKLIVEWSESLCLTLSPYSADSSRLGSPCEILIYYTLLDLSETIHILPNVWISALVEYTEMLSSVNDSVLPDIIIVCTRPMY